MLREVFPTDTDPDEPDESLFTSEFLQAVLAAWRMPPQHQTPLAITVGDLLSNQILQQTKDINHPFRLSNHQ
ncbi:hypothetical protein [Xenorhabdus sp. TH1]|uniref:hypothetical protein n=1 Tax=Xenorhabdus sp. TH1 TaxID=3130166 RepID=UPI0030D27320